MMARIKQIKQGLVTVLATESPLVGETTNELRDKIDACIETGEFHLVLDFQSVPFIDSTGLEMLLMCSRQARHKGGTMKIAHATEVCQDIFTSTRLGHVLEIYPDIPGALRSFL